MDLVNRHSLLVKERVISMRVTGGMISRMVKEHILPLKEINMKVTGKMIKSLVKEFIFGLMERSLLVYGIKI